MKMNTFDNLVLLQAAQGFISIRPGMKLSRASARLGASASLAEALSIASEVTFSGDADEMVRVAREIGRSCMKTRSELYRFWADTVNSNGEKCLAVAVYRNSRALVREDTMVCCPAYGPDAGQLIKGLEFLGFTKDLENFGNGLVFPSESIVSEEKTAYTTTQYVTRRTGWFHVRDRHGNFAGRIESRWVERRKVRTRRGGYRREYCLKYSADPNSGWQLFRGFCGDVTLTPETVEERRETTRRSSTRTKMKYEIDCYETIPYFDFPTTQTTTQKKKGGEKDYSMYDDIYME